MKPSPNRIDDLAALVAEQMPGIFADANDQITDAITAAMEDAKDAADAGQDKKAMLALSISVKWDLDGRSVVVSLPVSVRRRYEKVCQLDDPNQPKLPISDGTTMTISTDGMEPVTLTPEQLSTAAQRVKSAMEGGR